MSQPVASSRVSNLNSLQRQAIFLYLDLDVRLLLVCRKWQAEIHAALLSSWNHLPPILNEAKKSVLATHSGADYFKLFAFLNKYLIGELRQLDDQLPTTYRAAFSGQLTPRRFVDMQKKIISTQQLRMFWSRLRMQNQSLADIQSVPMMNKELTNPKRTEIYEKLHRLNLARIGFDLIPSQVFLLTKLKYLDLSGNQLTELPDEIVKLQNLVSINLSGNRLAPSQDKQDALVLKLSQLPLLQEIILDDKIIELQRKKAPSSCGQCNCTTQ